MTAPYRVLERKRSGEELDAETIGEVVRGAADGSCEGQPVPTELYGALYYNNNGTWQPVMGIGVPQ